MAVTINFYDKLVEYLGDGTMDMDDDTFKLALNTAYTFVATHNVWLDAGVSSTEIASANGYTTPGQNLTTPTWVETSGTVKFTAANVTWSASGGSIAATDAILYDDTVASPVVDNLICNIDFGATETAGDGTNFVVAWNASGIFTSVATDA